MISHIKLEKIKNYKNNQKVGTNYIYLGNTLLHKEDIYVKKNKTKKENVFTKIRKWFTND